MGYPLIESVQSTGQMSGLEFAARIEFVSDITPNYLHLSDTCDHIKNNCQYFGRFGECCSKNAIEVNRFAFKSVLKTIFWEQNVIKTCNFAINCLQVFIDIQKYLLPNLVFCEMSVHICNNALHFCDDHK